MSSTKGILACLLTILAVSAVVSSTATAASQYKIGGSVFTGTETISATLLALTFGGISEKKVTLTYKLPGGSLVVIECTALKANNAKIFGGNLDSAESLKFSGCKVVAPAGCELGDQNGNATTVINTTAVTAFIEELSSLSWVVFTPVAQPFVTYTLLACAGAGTFTINGRVRSLILTKTEEALKGINFDATTGDATVSLRLGTEPMTLTGLVGLTLSGTRKSLVWGVN